MLTKLYIRNYAIIEELEIRFDSRLNIFTGETGAGKSIIIGALGLIMGDRADTSVLPPDETKCIVEGFFSREQDTRINKFLSGNGLDDGPELLIRREVTAGGKSRAFVNDTPVNLEQLRQLAGLIADLHQQFDALQLGENDFQRDVLDAMAGHGKMIQGYQLYYDSWTGLNLELDRLKRQKEQFDRDADYNRFQFNELEEAAFSENELEEADAALKLLAHAEDIKSGLSRVGFELNEGENPLVQRLKIMINELRQYTFFSKELENLVERMQEAQVELHDISRDLSNLGTSVDDDPEKAEKLNERLSQGYKLLKKHHVKTTAELIQIRKELENKIQQDIDMADIISKKEAESGRLRQQALQEAKKISEGRIKQVKPLEEKVNRLLKQVGMPNARLKIEIGQMEELGPYGIDLINFLFDANKSGQFLPVRKVASGGELSRLMLCIKSLVAKKLDLPTLVFDEIDTGISGEAARQVGVIMKDLASSRQVVCITHQPQIAGKADAHYFVFKEIRDDKVKAAVKRLNSDERITAIAKMLSGEKPSAAALENAREMVMN